MSITDLRTAITTAGGTPTRFDHINLYRELVVAMGGTPQSWTVPNLLRELIVLKSAQPGRYDYVGLLREFITALGGTPVSYTPDALEAQMAGLALNSPYAAYALALDFKNGAYWAGGAQAASLAALPGYSYTRSGAKAERNALTSGDVIDDFAANVPGIVPGVGYWSRGATTNNFTRSQALDDAVWSKTALSVTANTVTAPDGTTTADTLTTNGAATMNAVTQNDAQLPGLTTYSVFAKAGTGRYLQLTHAGTSYVNFDLVAGVVGTNGGAGAVGYIYDCGGGWYRCVMVLTTASNANFCVTPVPAANSAFLAAYSATVETLHVWQVQSLLGSFPDGGPIIPTGATAASVGADALAVAAPAVTGDYIVECDLYLPSAGADGETLFKLTGAQPFIIRRLSGGLQSVVGLGTLNEAKNIGAGITTGPLRVIFRRVGGSHSLALRYGGVTTIGASTAGTSILPLTTVAPGQGDGTTINAVVERMLIQQGTFDDAAITAILEAA